MSTLARAGRAGLSLAILGQNWSSWRPGSRCILTWCRLSPRLTTRGASSGRCALTVFCAGCAAARVTIFHHPRRRHSSKHSWFGDQFHIVAAFISCHLAQLTAADFELFLLGRACGGVSTPQISAGSAGLLAGAGGPEGGPCRLQPRQRLMESQRSWIRGQRE